MLTNAVPQDVQLAHAVSRLCGWLYFLCWSGSFYPQPILNWRRKSTIGFGIDFPTLNILGFVALTISNAAFMFSPKIRGQYATRNPIAPEPTVQPNDLAFAAHALVLCLIVYSQFWLPVWSFKVGKFQKASWPILGVFWGCVAGVVISIIIAAAGPSHGDDPRRWAWIDVIYVLGYVKLVVTIVKYVPQAWLNYKRGSTVGWSILQILLDFAGGILSILQLILDASLQDDWSGITGNPVKFGLANITLFFDIVFIVQHYLLYPQREDETEDGKDDEGPRAGSEEESLLGNEH